MFNVVLTNTCKGITSHDHDPSILKTICTYDPRFNTSTARSLDFWKISILTNLEHIVLAYRLVSVQSIHGDPCSLNKNWYWRHSQGNLWFPPLDLIKNFKVPKKIVQFFYIFCVKELLFIVTQLYYIKPSSTHLPVCILHFSLPVHLINPASMQPTHLEVIGSQVGWGALHSWLLEQPGNMYF